MDWGLIFQVVGIGLTVVGLMIAGFWRMLALIRGVEDRAALRAEAAHLVANATRDELHAHKLAVAENYVSKAGLREVEERIMDGLGALGSQLSGMSGRIDRMFERPTSTRRTSGQS